MKRLDHDTYVLSSGKEIYANNGIIGLAEFSPSTVDEYGDKRDPFYIAEGYDSGLGGIATFTAEELMEIGQFMVEQWKTYVDELRHL